MAFPEDYLADDEVLVLHLKSHWWTFALPVALQVGALVLLILLITLFDVSFLTWLGWAVFLVALLYLAKVYAVWSTTSFVLTSERLMYRTGLLSKKGVEIPLDRINNTNFNQSVFERMIGAGDLLIESAGESGQSRFTNVRKPDAVQNAIAKAADQRITDLNRPIVQQAAAVSAADQIRQLGDLRRQGLISDAEFEAKKAELLGRM